uniref:Uncharacterized protein n=1 Tax=Caenorhabditis japonica TaxID=281687 RepID=A0A8R1HKW6_CAEJA
MKPTRSGGAITSRVLIPPNPFNKPVVTSGFEMSKPVMSSMTSEWSEWTKCNEETSTKNRQRVCNGCNEIIQFMPCFSTNNFDMALQKFIKEQQEKEAMVEAVKKLREQESEKKLLQQLDSPPTVIEFPQRVIDSNLASKNSIEFFGPPQIPQQPQPAQSMSTF